MQVDKRSSVSTLVEMMRSNAMMYLGSPIDAGGQKEFLLEAGVWDAIGYCCCSNALAVAVAVAVDEDHKYMYWLSLHFVSVHSSTSTPNTSLLIR
jgi:hypothetical protein